VEAGDARSGPGHRLQGVVFGGVLELVGELVVVAGEFVDALGQIGGVDLRRMIRDENLNQ